MDRTQTYSQADYRELIDMLKCSCAYDKNIIRTNKDREIRLGAEFGLIGKTEFLKVLEERFGTPEEKRQQLISSKDMDDALSQAHKNAQNQWKRILVDDSGFSQELFNEMTLEECRNAWLNSYKAMDGLCRGG